MKIFSRIIETLLAITILFSGIMATDEGCSCGQCYADEIQLATTIFFACIVAEIVILIIKAFKQHFMIGVLDFISTILLVVEVWLVVCLVLGVGFRTDDGIGEIMIFLVSLMGLIAIIGGIIYLTVSGSKRMKSKSPKSACIQEEHGEN
ncbi:MAG: hypothetical protein IKJ73_12005 [Lachnospiraceae bacterium]|nr:hypothetical protein [Lachnospiraceae bacterium]